jgi:hypothetical protein
MLPCSTTTLTTGQDIGSTLGLFFFDLSMGEAPYYLAFHDPYMGGPLYWSA